MNDDSMLCLKGETIFCRSSDGYVDLTQLCKAGGKSFKHWNENNYSSIFLKELVKDTGIPRHELLQIGTGAVLIKNKIISRHTWGHPRIATNIAQWISADFAVKVTKWIEVWKNNSEKNLQEFKHAIENIKPDYNTQAEKIISDRLALELKGSREIKIERGLIDVLTDDYIIEVKCADNWKQGLGQLLIYSLAYPEKIKRLHLFGTTSYDKEKIISDCSMYNIIATFEKD